MTRCAERFNKRLPNVKTHGVRLITTAKGGFAGLDGRRAAQPQALPLPAMQQHVVALHTPLQGTHLRGVSGLRILRVVVQPSVMERNALHWSFR